MARFRTQGLDSVIEQMKQLGEISGEVADQMLVAGAEEVKKAWKQSARINKHKDTGDMIDSIGFSRKPKKTSDIKSIDIYPQGRDRKGIRNAEKAFILNYGTSNITRSNWVDKADDLCEEPVEKSMIEIWDKELKKKGLI